MIPTLSLAPKTMTHAFKKITLVGLLAIWECISVGCSKPLPAESPSSQASSDALPKVATVKPKRTTLTQKTEQPGRIEAFAMTRIHSKVNGFVEQILVDMGDKVSGPKSDSAGNILEKGQLLAVIAAPELTDELAQKQAMVEQTEADIDQAKVAVTVSEAIALSAEAQVAEAMAGQRKAEAEYQRWKSEADRISVLASNKTVTAKLADETIQQRNAADAVREEVLAKIRFASAKQNESKVAISKAKADLKSIEAKLKIAIAEVQRLKSLCEYLQIRAPYNGIISARNFDPGSLIQVSQISDKNPLFVIVQTDKVRVSLSVPESDALLVNQEGKATIKVPTASSRIFEGKVARTSWVLNASTRTLDCEIEVLNEEGILRPGMYANVELVIAHKPDALAIPRTAILSQDGKPTCLVVTSDQSIVRRPLQTGIVTTTEVEILGGLEGAEEVIFANAAAFREGQKVQIAAKPST